ncbi:aldo/keto reductase [Elusimicrobiota bacterium]
MQDGYEQSHKDPQRPGAHKNALSGYAFRWNAVGTGNMKYKKLGATDVSVSAIGQGTGLDELYLKGTVDAQEYVRLLRRGFDLGMNLVDTAEVYEDGHSEELIGKAASGIRDKVIIATKFSPEHADKNGIIRALEGSLRRLKTDYIDLYQAHWSNPRIPAQETVSAMERLIADGKVRHIGLCNFSISEFRMAQDALSNAAFVSMQQEYNIHERSAEESLIPFCHEHSITLVAYTPLAKGRLATAGKSCATLADMAEKYSVTSAQLVLNWLVRDPRVVAIPRATREDHLTENANALEISIEQDDLERLSELFRPQITYLPTDQLCIVDDGSGPVYTTLEDAIANKLGMTPGPVELSKQINTGEFLKPVKVRFDSATGKYRVIDGKSRYWAWVIATSGKKPIPARIE